MKVQVLIRLKSGVLDVQGKAVEQCIHELSQADLSVPDGSAESGGAHGSDFKAPASKAPASKAPASKVSAEAKSTTPGKLLPTDSVSQVRIGKLVELQVKSSSFEQAKVLVEALCKKLLANPIIENYEIRQG